MNFYVIRFVTELDKYIEEFVHCTDFSGAEIYAMSRLNDLANVADYEITRLS